MNNIDLTALRNRAYKTACEHGFHDEELSNEHFLCLVVSELIEAVEADRKGKRARIEDYNKYLKWYSKWSKDSIGYKQQETKAFEMYIKDSVSDELADAAIRLFDLAGLRNIGLELATKDIDNCIDDMAEACKDETFTESIYSISILPERYKGLYDFTTTMNDMLLSIFGLARHLDIDLMWFIEQKMRYNELREKMHGKRY